MEKGFLNVKIVKLRPPYIIRFSCLSAAKKNIRILNGAIGVFYLLNKLSNLRRTEEFHSEYQDVRFLNLNLVGFSLALTVRRTPQSKRCRVN